jgi:hypothetical protein
MAEWYIDELLELFAFWTIEPPTDERADRRAAIIAATVANCNARAKDGRPFEVEEFMAVPPHDYAGRKGLTWQQSAAVFKAMAKDPKGKKNGNNRNVSS